MIFIVNYSRVSNHFKINFRKIEPSGEKSTPHKSSENLPVAFGGLLHLGVPYVTAKWYCPDQLQTQQFVWSAASHSQLLTSSDFDSFTAYSESRMSHSFISLAVTTSHQANLQ
jgi:hypothetical protein